jgi:hypothetical protein
LTDPTRKTANLTQSSHAEALAGASAVAGFASPGFYRLKQTPNGRSPNAQPKAAAIPEEIDTGEKTMSTL